MRCPNCGGTVQPGANRCVKCGSFVEQPVAQQTADQHPAIGVSEPTGVSDKSRVAAGILGIFLGWLGVHRFYLGYNSIGGLMLALSIVGLALIVPTCGFSWILVAGVDLWGIVEGIMILTGAINRDAEGRLLRN